MKKKFRMLVNAAGACLGAVWLTVLMYIGYVAILSYESQGWPKVPARVHQSSVVETQETGAARLGSLPFSRFTVEITFKYAVNGQNYTSDRFSLFRSLNGFSRFHAETLRKPYLAGNEVVAYYDPADPGRAVLAAGWRGISPSYVPTACLVSCVSLGIGTALIQGRGKHRRRAGAKKNR